MDKSPVNTFFRNVIGFLGFIGISFGVTYGVQSYTAQQTAAANQAAALQALIATTTQE